MANTLYAIAIYVSFYFVGGKLNVTRIYEWSPLFFGLDFDESMFNPKRGIQGGMSQNENRVRKGGGPK